MRGARAIAAPAFALALACMPAAHAAGYVCHGVEPGRIRLEGEVGRRIAATITNNFLKLDVARDFLPAFRRKGTKPDDVLGICSLVESAALFAVYSKRSDVLAAKRSLVSAVLEAQSPDGYIGRFAPAARLVEYGDIPECAALIRGLVRDWELFGETNSLAAARRAADWIASRWTDLPGDWDQGPAGELLFCDGLADAMLRLAAASGDARYLRFCRRERHLQDWNRPIACGRGHGLDGHVAAWLGQCGAQMSLFSAMSHCDADAAALLEPSAAALKFILRGDGAVVTGALGFWECWNADQDGGIACGETCATAAFMSLCDQFMRLGPRAIFGDLEERALFNALFAAQSPDGRRIRRFVPLEGPRFYSSSDHGCCPAAFRRIMGELPNHFYYADDCSLYVNLYSASEAEIKVGARTVRLRQETTYPSGDLVRITLEPDRPDAFALRLRIPHWCDGASVSVNDVPTRGLPSAGGFFAVHRTWRKGDVVELSLPMSVRAVAGRRRQSGRFALMRGPLVYAFSPKRAAADKSLPPAKRKVFSLEVSALADILSADSSAADLFDKPDATVRPGGTCCVMPVATDGMALGARSPNAAGDLVDDPSTVRVRLCEFADPDAAMTYFRPNDPADPEDDELFETGR